MIILNCKILLYDILISISQLCETLFSRREPVIISQILNSALWWAQSNIKNLIFLESSHMKNVSRKKGFFLVFFLSYLGFENKTIDPGRF